MCKDKENGNSVTYHSTISANQNFSSQEVNRELSLSPSLFEQTRKLDFYAISLRQKFFSNDL